MKKKLTIIIMLMLLATTVVMAEEQTDPNRQNLQDIEYKQLVIQQNLQTQNFIKTELAKRDEAQQKEIKAYVDENFRALDGRINGFIKQMGFKLGMIFISGVVLGGSILLLINNQLRKKNAVKKVLKQKNEEFILSGETITKVKEQVEPTITVEKPVKKKTSKTKKEYIVDTNTLKQQTIKPMGDY